ncbi:hypothetical protein V6N13_001562 [Hibiscus sabdariffa]
MQADLPSIPCQRFQHRQNKATSRWRGGPHGSIPYKQIGVVVSAQAIHAAPGPGHLEVASLLTVGIHRPNRRSPATVKFALVSMEDE